MKKLAAAKARQCGQEVEGALRNVWTQLSVLIQPGNAALLDNRSY